MSSLDVSSESSPAHRRNSSDGTPPRLSIVVPFYGVERYIAECLESLRQQSFTDFEVILVDDGSLDGSARIAEEYAAADDRFRIVRQENQGLGPARNTGAAEAVGEYLTFVDSDDVVPPYAYQRMIESLDDSGSDMAAGDARRFNDLGVRDSWAHKIPFATPRRRTHVREFPALALDRMAWNKMYRRTFWDKQGFAYPAGLYEDYPVTIASHLYAECVDVIATPVYYWRERDGGELSITQRVWELDNLRDRVTSAERVLDIVAEESPEVRGVIDRHFLHIDVAAVLGGLHRQPDGDGESARERATEIIELAARLVDRFDPEQVAAASTFDRLQAQMVSERRVDQILELVDHRAHHGRGAPLLVRGEGRHARFFRDLPGFGAGIPDETYEVSGREVNLKGRLRDSRWEATTDGDVLDLEIEVTVDTLDLTDADVQVHLVSPSGRSRPLAVETLAVGPARAVRLRLRPAELAEQEGPGHWWLDVDVHAAGIRRRGSIAGLVGPRTRWSEQRSVGGGLWAKPGSFGGRVGVTIRRPQSAVTEVSADTPDEVRVRGWFTPQPGKGGALPAIWFRLVGGDDVAGADVRPDPSLPEDPPGSAGFVATIDVNQFASYGLEDRITERSVWSARLAVGAEPPVNVAQPSEVGSASSVVGHRRVTFLPDPSGNMSVHEEYSHPRVHGVAVAEDGERLLWTGAVERESIRLDHARWRAYVTPEHRVDVDVPIEWSEGGRFRVAAPVTEMVDSAEAARAQAGDLVETNAGIPWSLWLVAEEDETGEPAVLATADVHAMPAELVAGGRRCTMKMGRMGRLSVEIFDD